MCAAVALGVEGGRWIVSLEMPLQKFTDYILSLLIEELFAANGFDHRDDEMTEKFAGFQYLSATLA